MNLLTTEKLDAMEQAAKQASPGEWSFVHADGKEADRYVESYEQSGDFWAVLTDRANEDSDNPNTICSNKTYYPVPPSKEDCQFIGTCSPPIILSLISEVRYLRQEVKAYESDYPSNETA